MADMAIGTLVLVGDVEPVGADVVSVVETLPQEGAGLPRDSAVVE